MGDHHVVLFRPRQKPRVQVSDNHVVLCRARQELRVQVGDILLSSVGLVNSLGYRSVTIMLYSVA